ncbi:50S ribosomal protein L22P [Pyrodictium delaneyi]|uniref:Large ribosomal subunit protein uL22 n=1 Tax=Pyrodictium delaneyi TaxID=1273541 RepID=A0A0N7JD32_9CREN|nr:50S ribosomal protein L22 [Pyrodictium delaneyi]ALL01065.1 50S ribosomal protein L22P [Pyrodictium delaneyi]OWJ55758.1 50S ribosomal protein L22 [Pyrodictium delaneyi]
MPTWHYSVRVDEERSAKAMVWDAPISYKKIVELARVIRGMRLEEARKFLERVAAGKEPIPVRRYARKQAHHRGLAARYKWPIGRYPVKAARILLKLLDNVANNAEVKGLDTEKLRIVHIAVHKGRVLKRWMPRAFGRSTPRFKKYSHIEVVVAEEE